MKKYSLHMQLPNGEWVRVSNQAYLLPSAQKVWKEVLLDAYRIGWPKRELRAVEDKVSEADLNPPNESSLMGFLRGRDGQSPKGGGETTNRVRVGRSDGPREMWLVYAVPQAPVIED